MSTSLNTNTIILFGKEAKFVDKLSMTTQQLEEMFFFEVVSSLYLTTYYLERAQIEASVIIIVINYHCN